MSYSQRPGVFISHTTKRRYDFEQRDPASMRQAKARLLHDDEVAQQAAARRAANVPPDTRSTAEIVRSEIVHHKRSESDVGKVMAVRIAELQSALSFAHTPQERSRIQRRIDALTHRQAEHQAVVEAAEQRQAQLDSPDVVQAIEEARQLLDDWRFRGDVAEEIVQGATAAATALTENLDVAAWRATAKELRAKHNADRQSKMEALRANIKELESQLFTVKADEAPPEATPTAPDQVAAVVSP